MLSRFTITSCAAGLSCQRWTWHGEPIVRRHQTADLHVDTEIEAVAARAAPYGVAVNRPYETAMLMKAFQLMWTRSHRFASRPPAGRLCATELK